MLGWGGGGGGRLWGLGKESDWERVGGEEL